MLLREFDASKITRASADIKSNLTEIMGFKNDACKEIYEIENSLP